MESCHGRLQLALAFVFGWFFAFDDANATDFAGKSFSDNQDVVVAFDAVADFPNGAKAFLHVGLESVRCPTVSFLARAVSSG